MMGCVRSCSKATFSYAISGVEGHRRPSPLVESISEIVHESTASPETSDFVPVLEMLPDVTPLPILKDRVAAGGIGVITTQAQCGFRAWAEHRLGLRGLDLLEAGLSPGERGEQVHTVLQAFWTKVKTHAELVRQGRSYPSEGVKERDVTLRACIDAVFPAETNHAWDAAYLQVQRERLFRLLSGWLDREAARPPFEVLYTELEVKGAEVGPLRLDMRVDRVDRVDTGDGGALLLIDYKTGRVNRNDWKGERLDQPQLPVYAIYGAPAGKLEDVRGIAFGNVRVGDKGNDFEEMAEGSLVGNGAKKNFHFDEQAAEWRRDLARLADAFAQGEAAVDPKDHRVTCKMCSQRLLCRLDLNQLEDDDLEDEEEDAPVW
jgi:RecB family exonuclease